MRTFQIKLQQIKLTPDLCTDEQHTIAALQNKCAKLLRIAPQDILGVQILRKSLDARKKPQLFYTFSVALTLSGALEKRVLNASKASKMGVEPVRYFERPYQFPASGSKPLAHRPVIIGTGPAGLFCGYYLALHGYRPILLERGHAVEERIKDVETFWRTGVLQTESNVQFGEGGAGTFSDGKLNTLVKDASGRNREVLRCFVENGANPEILYESKPHIGTDVLGGIVRNMRRAIIANGGEVRFGARVTGLTQENGAVAGVSINEAELLPAQAVVLAIGHSARDTLLMLHDAGILMERKSFAVGVRIEHPQTLIDDSQYGAECPYEMPAASYKLTAKAADGRSVYSFCMCPGGYVINASSEIGRLAINGMSYAGRAGKNANSAMIAAIDASEYDMLIRELRKNDKDSIHNIISTDNTDNTAAADNLPDVLAGVTLQRLLEERAYKAGRGRIPVQRFADFQAHMPDADECVYDMPGLYCETLADTRETPKEAHNAGKMRMESCSMPVAACEIPQMKGAYTFGDVRGIFPRAIGDALCEGIIECGKKIRGFADPNVLVSGVESRTSSPVRIVRGETFESSLAGLYPCGEGAGYAGGITSAAMDGLKIAEAIAQKYATPE